MSSAEITSALMHLSELNEPYHDEILPDTISGTVSLEIFFISFMISLSDIPIENAAFADVLVIAHCSEISAFRG